jgi:hypothetical protein
MNSIKNLSSKIDPIDDHKYESVKTITENESLFESRISRSPIPKVSS